MGDTDFYQFSLAFVTEENSNKLAAKYDTVNKRYNLSDIDGDILRFDTDEALLGFIQFRLELVLREACANIKIVLYSKRDESIDEKNLWGQGVTISLTKIEKSEALKLVMKNVKILLPVLKAGFVRGK